MPPSRLQTISTRTPPSANTNNGPVSPKKGSTNKGASAGPISYTYTVGPDGRQYATGGSVSVRISNPSGDPAKLAEAAARLSTAANAAHNPSAADLAAARKGYQAAGAALEQQHRNTDLSA